MPDTSKFDIISLKPRTKHFCAIRMGRHGVQLKLEKI